MSLIGGLIGQLRTSTGGIQGLGKVDKIYLDNPNLIYTLGSQNVEIGTVRETFFYNQTHVFCQSRCHQFQISSLTANTHLKSEERKRNKINYKT